MTILDRALTVASPAEWVALTAILWASLQLVLARWRDLGPMTVGFVGAALVVLQIPPVDAGERVRVVALLALAVGLATLAWSRGAPRGVGRLALDAVVAFAAFVAGVVPAVAGPAFTPLAGGIVVPLLLIAALSLVLALERPGPRPVCVRVYRQVPIA